MKSFCVLQEAHVSRWFKVRLLFVYMRDEAQFSYHTAVTCSPYPEKNKTRMQTNLN